MPIDIDGYGVLGVISRERQSFPSLKDDVSKIARQLVVKQLKHKTTDLEHTKAILIALGAGVFDLIVDLMTGAEVKSLLTKLDRFNAEAKGAATEAQRSRISDLAKGAVSPVSKTVVSKPAKPPRQPKTPVERAVGSRAMRAKKRV